METSELKPVVVTKPKTPVLAGDRGLTFSDMDSMYRFCVAVVNSGTFREINTPEIALVRLQAGLELGLSPIWSITNIFVVNGRPAVWGGALQGIIQRQPDLVDLIQTYDGQEGEDSFKAVCKIVRAKRLPVIAEFSVADAKKAGLWNKPGPWQTYSKRMLKWRALGFAAHDAYDDALHGLQMVEEIRDAAPVERTATPKPEIVLPDEVEANAP